jgi:hypothetical protein
MIIAKIDFAILRCHEYEFFHSYTRSENYSVKLPDVEITRYKKMNKNL